MDSQLLGRHPFPGPGLAMRILGDLTEEKVRILQEVDAIFIDGLKKYKLPNRVNKLLKRVNINMNNIYKEMSLYNTNPDDYKQELKK
jgi:GMP synthase PP-ATPase subunit